MCRSRPVEKWTCLSIHCASWQEGADGRITGYSMEEFLSDQLLALNGDIELGGRELHVDEKLSPKYGVYTKYVKTIFFGSLNNGADQVQVTSLDVPDGFLNVEMNG